MRLKAIWATRPAGSGSPPPILPQNLEPPSKSRKRKGVLLKMVFLSDTFNNMLYWQLFGYCSFKK